jgi:D-aminopeptidase
MDNGRPRVEFREEVIDAIFRRIDQSHLPGGAVGIAVDGKPLYRKGFGLANLELPVVLSPTIRLRIGSVSKHFTCLTYLLLCEEGKAGVDDTVGMYFPRCHAVTRRATMRQLMGNTSGIRDAYHVFDLFNDAYTDCAGAAQSVTSAALLGLYAEINDANAAPDSAWIYNNGGWLLLSLAIERICGCSLEEVMRNRLFKPIGMHETQLLRSDREYVRNRAAQHVVNPAGGFEKMYWGVDNYLGAGAIVSTVDDMLRWMAHMDEPSVGSEATWNLMRTPRPLANGTLTGYALGLMVDSYRGVATIHHGGNALGGNAQMLKVPELGLDVIVIVNRQDVSSVELTDQILDGCLRGLKPVKEPFAGPFATGTYRSPISGRVIQLFGKDGRQFGSVGGIDLPLEPDENGVFWCWEMWRSGKLGITLIGDPLQPTAIRFDDFGEVDELLRENEVAQADADSIVGSYSSTATQVDATVSITGSGAQLSARGPFGAVAYRLECLSNGVWRAKPEAASRVGYLGGILTFAEDGNSFTFSNYQMRALPFKRSHAIAD